jgi:hypothetical protein
VTVSEHVAGEEEPYLLVEEVAERLGLPLSVLLHRVEAGDIPARRVEAEDGTHYALRLGDLGIELDDAGMPSSAIEGDESTLSATFEPPGDAPEDSGVVFEPSDAAGVHSAIVSAFNSGPEQVPGDRQQAGGAASSAPPGRPREPQQPPPWIIDDPPAGDTAGADAPEQAEDAEPEVELPGSVAREQESSGSAGGPPPDAAADAAGEHPAVASPPAGDAARAGGTADDEPTASSSHADQPDDDESVVAEFAVPAPARGPVGLLDSVGQSPRGDLASMSLDARELVAGLLDRWERTLEQRIYTEQRQRFQAELMARQNVVKELQMELHTARAEHAAAQAEKDRILAAKERELADRERDLAETRRRAEEAQQQSATSRRRRWFRGRDD